MIRHDSITDAALRSMIREGKITMGGNRRLKIFGTLRCVSGKRLKRSYRVFFPTEKAAIRAGYRPCGRCLRNKYQEWKIANR